MSIIWNSPFYLLSMHWKSGMFQYWKAVMSIYKFYGGAFGEGDLGD